MSWLNPWAFAGLFAVALPLLIHLLGRGTARVNKFPSLRFVESSRLLPSRRTRLHDLFLLAVRIAVLVVAAAALAHPLYVTAARRASLDASLARAIIVDTSASMRRLTAGGASAMSAARGEGARLAAAATTSLVISTMTPADAIAGAREWLRVQSGRTELVVISDFQIGSIDSLDLAAVEAGNGILLARIAVPSASAAGVIAGAGSRIGTALSETSEPRVLRVLAGAGERAAVADVRRAVAAVASRMLIDTVRHIALVTPDFEGRAALLAASTALTAPWMGDAVVRLRLDRSLAAASENAIVRLVADSAAGLVVARNAERIPTAIATAGRVDGVDHLLLWSLTDAGTLPSAALLTAASRVVSLGPPAAEREPETLKDSVLKRWERAPATSALARANTDRDKAPSDARWFWIAAFVLLAAESLLRKSSALALSTRLAGARER